MIGNFRIRCCFVVLSLLFPLISCQKVADPDLPGHRPVMEILPGSPLQEVVVAAARVTPSPRQYAWQQLETIAFAHFGINTFTDREWGDGREDPQLFNPTEFDAEQWVRILKYAGIELLILTAKHHDGFCLWPSRYTEHSVKNSPWRNGQGDVVSEVAAACRKHGLKFGVYLSPWDRHDPRYGTEEYNTYFKNQLRELLTQYGEVAEVWFDGACGEGPNGKRQIYDWPGFYSLVRELQPNAVIAIMGPDVRWVGTESGYGRITEWSVLPADFTDPALTAELSQKDIYFVPAGDKTAEDLGSRDRLKGATKLVWYPSEADVSIRPGWFYHANQDGQVKSPEKLVDIYFSSVGRNSVLLLNVPPDRRGRIHEQDSLALVSMHNLLKRTFATNLAEKAFEITASSSRKQHPASLIIEPSDEKFWMAAEGDTSAVLSLKFDRPVEFDCLCLQENILVGQRIESFYLEVETENGWQQIGEGTTVGYKRLLRFPPVRTKQVHLHITCSRLSPTLRFLGLYKMPAAIEVTSLKL